MTWINGDCIVYGAAFLVCSAREGGSAMRATAVAVVVVVMVVVMAAAHWPTGKIGLVMILTLSCLFIDLFPYFLSAHLSSYFLLRFL